MALTARFIASSVIVKDEETAAREIIAAEAEAVHTVNLPIKKKNVPR